MNVMPPEVAEIRAEICGRCPTPCDKVKDARFHQTPCSSCPLMPAKWRHYGRCETYATPSRGLGDLVHAIAQPIAKAIDSVAGTNIQGCNACKQRREALNKLVPRIGE